MKSGMRHQQGFTLIELLAVIALLGILLGIAVPGMQAYLSYSAHQTARANLLTAIQFARSEAVNQRQAMRVCRLNAAGNACEAGNNWADNGWAVTRVADNNLLRTWPGVNTTYVSLTNAALGADNEVRFAASGRATQQPSFILVDNRRQRGTRIDINLSGRTSLMPQDPSS